MFKFLLFVSFLLVGNECGVIVLIVQNRPPRDFNPVFNFPLDSTTRGTTLRTKYPKTTTGTATAIATLVDSNTRRSTLSTEYPKTTTETTNAINQKENSTKRTTSSEMENQTSSTHHSTTLKNYEDIDQTRNEQTSTTLEILDTQQTFIVSNQVTNNETTTPFSTTLLNNKTPTIYSTIFQKSETETLPTTYKMTDKNESNGTSTTQFLDQPSTTLDQFEEKTTPTTISVYTTARTTVNDGVSTAQPTKFDGFITTGTFDGSGSGDLDTMDDFTHKTVTTEDINMEGSGVMDEDGSGNMGEDGSGNMGEAGSGSKRNANDDDDEDKFVKNQPDDDFIFIDVQSKKEEEVVPLKPEKDVSSEKHEFTTVKNINKIQESMQNDNSSRDDHSSTIKIDYATSPSVSKDFDLSSITPNSKIIPQENITRVTTEKSDNIIVTLTSIDEHLKNSTNIKESGVHLIEITTKNNLVSEKLEYQEGSLAHIFSILSNSDTEREKTTNAIKEQELITVTTSMKPELLSTVNSAMEKHTNNTFNKTEKEIYDEDKRETVDIDKNRVLYEVIPPQILEIKRDNLDEDYFLIIDGYANPPPRRNTSANYFPQTDKNSNGTIPENNKNN